jgi:hypothetical protein
MALRRSKRRRCGKEEVIVAHPRHFGPSCVAVDMDAHLRQLDWRLRSIGYTFGRSSPTMQERTEFLIPENAAKVRERAQGISGKS